MGLAMAVKQTPWFVAVFVVTGIVLEVRDRGMRRRCALACVMPASR